MSEFWGAPLTIVESQLQTLKANSQDTNFVIEDKIPAATILIHPHYKPLAGRFFDLLPLRESIFGMPGHQKAVAEEPEKKPEPPVAAEVPAATAETPAPSEAPAGDSDKTDSQQQEGQKQADKAPQDEKKGESKVTTLVVEKPEPGQPSAVGTQKDELQSAAELPIAAHSSGKETAAAQPYTDVQDALAHLKPPIKKSEDNETMPPELPLRLLELMIECMCCDGSIRMQDMDDSCLLVINANGHCYLKITKLVNFLLRKAIEKKILPAGFKKERASYAEIARIWSQEGYIDRMSEHKIFERQTLEANLLSPSKKKYELSHTTDNFTILNTNNLEKLASRTGRYSVSKKLNEVYKKAYPEHNSEV